MKKINRYVGLFLFITSSVNFMYAAKPKSSLSAWHNTIEKADFVQTGDGSYVMTFYCEKKPICFYMPHSYAESMDVDKKRYILPRTAWSDVSMNNFMNAFKSQLKALHADCKIYKRSGSDYSLGLLFEIDSSEYEVEKNIDEAYKAVSFTIKNK